MTQKCFASISDTGLHCAWCTTREIYWNLKKLDQAYCEKHEKPCEEMGGYHPEYWWTDKEEQQFRNELRNGNKV